MITNDSKYRPLWWRKWLELEEPAISYIEDQYKVEVGEARVIDSQSIFIEAEVLAGVSNDVLIDKWAYDMVNFPLCCSTLFGMKATFLPVCILIYRYGEYTYIRVYQ
jgi:hypothetical protein